MGCSQQDQVAELLKPFGAYMIPPHTLEAEREYGGTPFSVGPAGFQTCFDPIPPYHALILPL
jgi:hypothetical protein